MLQGLLISPVIVGRITIGKTVDINGVKMPEISDEFHITSTAQESGEWIPHPVEKELLQSSASEKLKSIPVRLMFNTPDNNFRAGYACFSNENKQICASSGSKATRIVKHIGVKEVDCRGPEFCEFGIANNCKLLGRLLISLEPEFKKDPLSGFVFRTTGYNSANALASRVNQFFALTDGKMSGMPCNLVLRTKSNPGAKDQTFYYVDLEPRESLFTAVLEARKYHKECEEKGINLTALDKAVTACYAGIPFIEDPGDAEIIRSEFYPDSKKSGSTTNSVTVSKNYESSTHGGVADMLFDKHDQQPSIAIKEILAQIDNMTDPKLFDSARIWIKNKRGLKNETERQLAFNRLDDRIRLFNQPSNDLEEHEYSIEMIEITNRIANITDPTLVEAAKKWIIKKQYLKNPFEFQKAMRLLEIKASELLPIAQKVA